MHDPRLSLVLDLVMSRAVQATRLVFHAAVAACSSVPLKSLALIFYSVELKPQECADQSCHEPSCPDLSGLI